MSKGAERETLTIEQYYDRYGWIYPLLWGNCIHWGRFKTGKESLDSAILQWSDEVFGLLAPKSGQRILDVGCGPATTARRLSLNSNVDVVGIDISEYQLSRARHSNSDLLNTGRLQLIKSDIIEVDGSLNSFDAAISEATFFHLNERARGLKNVRKLLNHHGTFVFDDIVCCKDIPHHELAVAFGRFGELHFEKESCYPKLLNSCGFTISTSKNITEDVAQTYLRLLDNLESETNQSFPLIPQPLYKQLRNSFRRIVEFLWDGHLSANLYSLSAE